MTHASDLRPVRRVVDAGALGKLVVEVGARTFVVRPYRGRRPLFEATHGEVVRSVLLSRAPKPKRRGVRRGAK